jgi:hypothetical protein
MITVLEEMVLPLVMKLRLEFPCSVVNVHLTRNTVRSFISLIHLLLFRIKINCMWNEYR